jgi:hypothetical protein
MKLEDSPLGPPQPGNNKLVSIGDAIDPHAQHSGLPSGDAPRGSGPQGSSI